jgi:hypothetical protein
MSDALPDRRFTPWLEGALAAALVLGIYALAGDALRASYHGYLHAAIGEAVLRDGLRPENPWHAGSALRYYTLYPALGALIGRAGPGPLWGFALLNAAAALCFAPALDALGRALGLRFAARRAAFVAAVLGFNGLGWIGMLAVDAPRAADGGVLPPVFATMPLTFAGEPVGWDARLQAFLPKFLNASSFALAVPFALWALAAAPRGDRDGASRIVPGIHQWRVVHINHDGIGTGDTRGRGADLHDISCSCSRSCHRVWNIRIIKTCRWRPKISYPTGGIKLSEFTLADIFVQSRVRIRRRHHSYCYISSTRTSIHIGTYNGICSKRSW